MPAAMQQIALVLALLGVADAHPEPVASEEGCTCEAGAKPFESYHIHVTESAPAHSSCSGTTYSTGDCTTSFGCSRAKE